MAISRLLAILGILAVLGLAACGDDEEDGSNGGEEQASSDAPVGGGYGGGGASQAKEDEAGAADGTEVELASSQFGEILFDSKNQAIYLFDKESSSQSECYGECAAAWPPVLTDGEPVARAGTNEKLLGTTERDDGSSQVTYGGHPLYYYAHEGPGEVLCHGVDEFGGLWLVVDAAGNALPA